MNGRPPKPTALLKLTGGYRGDRHAARLDASDVPLTKLPEPPEWMTDALRMHWKRFGGTLLGLGVMQDRYVESLAALCVAYQAFIDAATGNGGDIDRAHKRLMDSLSRHGLTPSSAASIRVGSQPSKPTGLTALRLTT